MTKSVLAAMLFILALSGCARTTQIEKEQTKDEYYMNINEECENKYAVLRLQDKDPFRVYNVSIGPDTASWTDVNSGKIKYTNTDSIYSVQVTDRAGGALSGLSLGLLGGALAGVVYTEAITGPTSHPDFPATYGAIGGAFVGAIAGSVIGGVIGRPSYFIINEKTKFDCAKGEATTDSSQNTENAKYDNEEDYASNVFFGEVFGNGVVFSVNYERFISRHAGFRIGAGFRGVYPVMFNFYPGDNKLRPELGFGLIYLTNPSLRDVLFIRNRDIDIALGMTVGLRYQPPKGGFVLRFGLTPFYHKGEKTPFLWLGLSAGYAF